MEWSIASGRLIGLMKIKLCRLRLFEYCGEL